VFWPLGRAARMAQQLVTTGLAGAGMQRGYYGVLAALGPADRAALAGLLERITRPDAG
jgi:hypothetical protein